MPRARSLAWGSTRGPCHGNRCVGPPRVDLALRPFAGLHDPDDDEDQDHQADQRPDHDPGDNTGLISQPTAVLGVILAAAVGEVGGLEGVGAGEGAQERPVVIRLIVLTNRATFPSVSVQVSSAVVVVEVLSVVVVIVASVSGVRASVSGRRYIAPVAAIAAAVAAITAAVAAVAAVRRTAAAKPCPVDSRQT